MIRKTSAMVEAGILAAVAIVMALISMYVPVLGAFVNFVWPLPIVICGCRHRLEHYDAAGCYRDYRDDYQPN